MHYIGHPRTSLVSYTSYKFPLCNPIYHFHWLGWWRKHKHIAIKESRHNLSVLLARPFCASLLKYFSTNLAPLFCYDLDLTLAFTNKPLNRIDIIFALFAIPHRFPALTQSGEMYWSCAMYNVVVINYHAISCENGGIGSRDTLLFIRLRIVQLSDLRGRNSSQLHVRSLYIGRPLFHTNLRYHPHHYRVFLVKPHAFVLEASLVGVF